MTALPLVIIPSELFPAHHVVVFQRPSIHRLVNASNGLGVSQATNAGAVTLVYVLGTVYPNFLCRQGDRRDRSEADKATPSDSHLKLVRRKTSTFYPRCRPVIVMSCVDIQLTQHA